MARNDPQINIRLPYELLQRIAGEATANNRSTAAEIVSRLEASGETLRDRFAGQALAGIIRAGVADNFEPEAAARAYRYADAMLAERSAS